MNSLEPFLSLLRSRKLWISLLACGITLGAVLSNEITWTQATGFFTMVFTGLVLAIGLEDFGKGAERVRGETAVKLASLRPPPLHPVERLPEIGSLIPGRPDPGSR